MKICTLYTKSFFFVCFCILLNSCNNSPRYYKIGENLIAADSVPSTGIYKSELGVIKVIIEGDLVRFQAGDNVQSLSDRSVRSEGNGYFYIEDFGQAMQYDDKGTFTQPMGTNNEEDIIEYIKEASEASNNTSSSSSTSSQMQYCSNHDRSYNPNLSKGCPDCINEQEIKNVKMELERQKQYQHDLKRLDRIRAEKY